jgi:hypothetical protein
MISIQARLVNGPFFLFVVLKIDFKSLQTSRSRISYPIQLINPTNRCAQIKERERTGSGQVSKKKKKFFFFYKSDEKTNLAYKQAL